MRVLKLLLIPISLIYGIITWIRNIFFDFGLLSSKSFSLPVISIGNLSTGGTGKTPHTEYLIRLLNPKFNLAILSRGYGRKSKGFQIADKNSLSSDIGDEPLQISSKFPDIDVIVNVDRVEGIKKILHIIPDTEVVILDDAFQHRYVKPGLSILLTEYSNLYTDDFLLPTGNLREFASGASRADIIIVTKTPAIFSPIDRRLLIAKINPAPYQHVYFSYTLYADLIALTDKITSSINKEYCFTKEFTIVLLTGIANHLNIFYYLKSKVQHVIPITYKDHYQYTINDIEELRKIFNNIASDKKIIITTEKDAMRLKLPEIIESINTLPIYYLPIEIDFHGNDSKDFNQKILDYVR